MVVRMPSSSVEEDARIHMACEIWIVADVISIKSNANATNMYTDNMNVVVIFEELLMINMNCNTNPNAKM